jgi:formate dehydrogenase beta subunit
MGRQSVSTWGAWSSGRKAALADHLPNRLGPDQPLRAFMGWDGLFIHDPGVNIVDMTRAYAQAARHETCGQCFPCRLGFAKITAILEAICQGRGQAQDLDQLAFLAQTIMASARCDIGQTAPRPIVDALRIGRDAFEKAITAGIAVAPGRYVARITAPCMNACPTHVNIPDFLEKIRFGRWDKALAILRRDCNLPGVIGRVCVRPCEGHCRRQRLDQGIAIRALNRFTADRELAKGGPPALCPGEPRSKKVAIIGAGPAGLACAYYLGQAGYRSTIFEALEEPGGMAAVGIPAYRLPRAILRAEAAQVQALGAEIRYGVQVGRDIGLQDLQARGYEAVFVAVGAHEASKMRCEGEEAGYQCFMTGIEFLRRVAMGERPIEGRKLLVIGGGNVAMDCARSARRLGFADVNLLYRRTEAEMPADPLEIKEAREEGVVFHYLVAPVKIIAENNKVKGLQCLKMGLGAPDKSGRRRPVPKEGSDFIIRCDAIIPAIGQTCVVDCVLPEEKVAVTAWKTLVADPITFQTGKPTIFSGGDCLTGPATLIGAIAAGKNAARFIAQFLEKGACRPSDEDYMDRLIATLGVFDAAEPMPFTGTTRKMHPPVMDPRERVQCFDEVEAGVDQPQAEAEANRCLRCFRLAMASI